MEVFLLGIVSHRIETMRPQLVELENVLWFTRSLCQFLIQKTPHSRQHVHLNLITNILGGGLQFLHLLALSMHIDTVLLTFIGSCESEFISISRI